MDTEASTNTPTSEVAELVPNGVGAEVKDIKEDKKVSSFGKIRESQANKSPKVNLDEEITKEITEIEGSDEVAKTISEVEKGDSTPAASTESASEVAKEVLASTEEVKEVPNEISDEQIKAYFEKQGIVYENIDSLKEKLAPSEVLTPEEIQKRANEADKKYVDLFVQGGGTVDQYVDLKSIANENPLELSKRMLMKELKESGLSEEEAQQYIEQSYYQGVSEEELEMMDEDDRARELKFREAGTKRLEAYSSNIQKMAQKALNDLKSASELEGLQKQEEEQLSAKIAEHFSTVPRKLTFNLGESNGKAISPIEYEISDKQIAEAKNQLTDPELRKQFLQNEDGSLNIPNIVNAKLENIYLRSLVKASYLEAQDRATKEVESRFPSTNPYEIGIGANQSNQKFTKGKVAAFGALRAR